MVAIYSKGTKQLCISTNSHLVIFRTNNKVLDGNLSFFKCPIRRFSLNNLFPFYKVIMKETLLQIISKFFLLNLDQGPLNLKQRASSQSFRLHRGQTMVNGSRKCPDISWRWESNDVPSWTGGGDDDTFDSLVKEYGDNSSNPLGV